MAFLRVFLTHMLTALYRPLWPALVLTFFASCFYLYAYEPIGAGEGFGAVLRGWLRRLKESPFFRRLLLLGFCTTMILFQTLLNRGIASDPLQNALGSLVPWVRTADGTVVPAYDCIENAIMLLPFTFLLLWTFGSMWHLPDSSAGIVWWATKVAFACSFSIELLQLVLHLGNWQLSDLFYNTLGGAAGGALYCLSTRIHRAH